MLNLYLVKFYFVLFFVLGLPWALEVISSYMAFTYADSRASSLALDIINLFTVTQP
jgi:hypothetical protein